MSTLLWADLRNRFVWITLAVTVGFGAIGFCDDYLKLVVGNSRGLIGALEVFLAVAARPGRRGVAVSHRARAGRNRFLRAVRQDA